MLTSSLRPVALCTPLVSLLVASSFGSRCHAQSMFPLVTGSPYDFEVCRSATLDICFEQHALSPLSLDGATESFLHDTAGEVLASETVRHLGGRQYELTITFESPTGADLYPAGGTDSAGNPIVNAALGLGHLDHPFQFQAPVRVDSLVLLAHSPFIPPPFPNPIPLDATELVRLVGQLDPWDGTFPRPGGVYTASPGGTPVLGLGIHRVDAVLTMTVIPEPSTFVLLALGGGFLGCASRRSKCV